LRFEFIIMIILENIKIALTSLRINIVRSLLTMLGIIIGVSSVIIFISVGEGVKGDVEKEVLNLGSNLIIVIGGQFDENGGMDTNPANFVQQNILKEKDLETIRELPEVEAAADMSLIPGLVSYKGKIIKSAMIISMPADIKDITNYEIEKGELFAKGDKRQVVVIGYNIAEKLFSETDPLGEKLKIGQRDFEIIGTLKRKTSESIFGGSELDSFVVLPKETAKKLFTASIFRILVKVKKEYSPEEVKELIKEKILSNHQGAEDFSVLTQEDLLSFLNKILSLLTALITAIAAISLIVGGVGIMNIMLVSVTERTREIGLRKACGATFGMILIQFLIEAIILSLFGGALGLVFSYLGVMLIKYYSVLNPEITSFAVFIALGASALVGIVFGVAPAISAAKKDPIEALRYE